MPAAAAAAAAAVVPCTNCSTHHAPRHRSCHSRYLALRPYYELCTTLQRSEMTRRLQLNWRGVQVVSAVLTAAAAAGCWLSPGSCYAVQVVTVIVVHNIVVKVILPYLQQWDRYGAWQWLFKAAETRVLRAFRKAGTEITSFGCGDESCLLRPKL